MREKSHQNNAPGPVSGVFVSINENTGTPPHGWDDTVCAYSNSDYISCIATCHSTTWWCI
ncbi:unnamed protein product [Linum tenue]|uniref:Uncharacterized protein n=1 Tax=Linum tenue TaxID=586396 RepID=A0AAV0L5K3_9ROSI|nr:unnamed protein product [Linum tenue]